MMIFKKIKRYISEYQKRRSLKKIRKLMFCFGYDCSYITDQELTDRLFQLTNLANKGRVTFEESFKSLSACAELWYSLNK